MVLWRREWWAPTLLSAAMFAGVLPARPTLDGHEVLVAQTAREMLANGDFVHPTFAGESRLQKPPLAYWLCAVSFLIFGENETAARLPSALAAVLGVAMTAIFARKMFGPAMGLLAGCVQATSLWTISYGRLALVDSLLTTLMIAAMLSANWDRLRPGARSNRWAVPSAFWTIAGLMVLAKGPVGMALLLPPVLIYRFVRGVRESDAPLFWGRSAAVGGGAFLVLALAWPVAVLLKRPEAWALWFGQSVGRFQEHWGPQTRPWWYFFVQTPWLLFPWSLPLVAVAVRRPRIDLRDPHRLLVLLWFATAFLLCTFSAGKRAHYILPGLPAACIVAALAVRKLLLPSPLAGEGLGVRRARGRVAPVTRLAAWVVFIALAETLAFAAFVGPGEDLTGFRQMVERNRSRLQHAEVVQVGSRNRATVFLVDRPLRWLPTPPDGGRPILALTPEKNLPQLLAAGNAKLIDRAGPSRSRAENAEAALALIELAPTRR